MLEIIQEQLDEVERSENVRILHAVESGSRAWGFASPDSDYDVRFIYVRPVEDYLRLEDYRDVIEWRLDDVLDINGWDIRKTLKLLRNSNPTLFEWSNSSIVYKSSDYWMNLQEEIDDFFLVKTSLYHYLNTAKGNYREYLKGEKVILKKYFYVMRPLLAALWILDNQGSPPLLFSELVESKLDDDMQPIIANLLSTKMSTPEISKGPRIDELNRYIEDTIEQLEAELESIPYEEKLAWDRFDELFLRALQD